MSLTEGQRNEVKELMNSKFELIAQQAELCPDNKVDHWHMRRAKFLIPETPDKGPECICKWDFDDPKCPKCNPPEPEEKPGEEETFEDACIKFYEEFTENLKKAIYKRDKRIKTLEDRVKELEG